LKKFKSALSTKIKNSLPSGGNVKKKLSQNAVSLMTK